MSRILLARRRFEVPVGLEDAWAGLSEAERWPEWAPHIRQVVVEPPGPLTAESRGHLRLTGGLRSGFTVSAWHPMRRWEWTGTLLGLRVQHDHRFQAAGSDATELEWVVHAEGATAGSLGRGVGFVYRKLLDRAIPRLIDWFASRTPPKPDVAS
jgi:hypothetical protein